jgi:hypothetical protein
MHDACDAFLELCGSGFGYVQDGLAAQQADPHRLPCTLPCGGWKLARCVKRAAVAFLRRRLGRFVA